MGDPCHTIGMLNATNTEALLVERDRLHARMDEMRDTYHGCDWCCGGGDEEMEWISARLDEIAAAVAGRPVPASRLREELLSLYSDMYKDRRGFRPRHMADWTVADFERAISALEREPIEEWETSHWGEGETDQVTEYQPTSGEGWAFTPAQ